MKPNFFIPYQIFFRLHHTPYISVSHFKVQVLKSLMIQHWGFDCLCCIIRLSRGIANFPKCLTNYHFFSSSFSVGTDFGENICTKLLGLLIGNHSFYSGQSVYFLNYCSFRWRIILLSLLARYFTQIFYFSSWTLSLLLLQFCFVFIFLPSNINKRFH